MTDFLTMLFVPKYQDAAGNQVSRLEWSFTPERARIEGGVTGGFVVLLPAQQPTQLVVSSTPIFDDLTLDVTKDGSAHAPDETGVLVEWWISDVGLRVEFTNAKTVAEQEPTP